MENYTTMGCENVWIIKNKTSSKGVGISLHNSSTSIAKH
jgi:parallel beta-helix repeat protein